VTLAAYLTDGSADPLTEELATWLASSPRFRAFADAHRDKIRKKLRSATDADAQLDVRAELRVAQRLLADRRIELSFEPAGSTRGGPDFAVRYRTHPAFNLEVTRLRTAPDAAGIGRVVLAKLRQLPTSSANVLLVAVGSSVPHDLLGAAAQELRSRADASDPVLLERGRFEDRRHFYERYLRLGAVIAWADAAATAWINPSARIGVPGRALDAVLSTLDQRG
jgi:hypothetical protein